MNETNHPTAQSDVSWPTTDHRVHLPDTSTLPDSEQAPPAVVGALKHAVQDVHDTIGRAGDRAAPTLRQLSESASAVGEKLQAKADQMRETRDAWVEGARATVRSNPLVSVAAALALGTVIGRITR